MDIEMTEEQYEVFKKFCTEFHIIHMLNFISYEELISAIEFMENNNQTRFVKKNIKNIEKYWQNYYGVLQKALSPENFALIVDYSNEAYIPLEPKIAFFRGAVAEYLSKGSRRTTSTELAARLITATTMFKLSVLQRGIIIGKYTQTYHFDFSPIFMFTDMTELARETEKMTRRLFPKTNTSAFEDTVCVNAFDRIIDALSDKKFFSSALHAAIDKNTIISRIAVADKLSQKYNVK